MLGNNTKTKEITKTTAPIGLFLNAPRVLLSIIISSSKLNKKYTAAYLERNAKPKNKPNNKKFNIELLFLVSKSTIIPIVQNNNNNKSVEIKKEERLAAGIIKKLKPQKTEPL